jgi:hypothetical protein
LPYAVVLRIRLQTAEMRRETRWSITFDYGIDAIDGAREKQGRGTNIFSGGKEASVSEA